MDNFLAIAAGLATLVYIATRLPRFRTLPISILDMFVLGLVLYAVGSVFVFQMNLTGGHEVMRIAMVATISGALASAIWFVGLRRLLPQRGLFEHLRTVDFPSGMKTSIYIGIAVSMLVCLAFVAAVAIHGTTGPLLWAALNGEATFTEARKTITAGSSGYFYPGYVKQFRDILLPLLCAALILYDRGKRFNPLVYLAVIVGLAAMLITGQRLLIVQMMLILLSAIFVTSVIERSLRLRLLLPAMLVVAVCGATLVQMTVMLGRLEMKESPLIEKARIDEPAPKLAPEPQEANGSKAAASAPDTQMARAEEKSSKVSETAGPQAAKAEKTATPTPDTQMARAEEKSSKASETAGPPKTIVETSTANSKDGSETRESIVGSALLSLIRRGTITVPLENTLSYGVWSKHSEYLGQAWITQAKGLRPGTQLQLSNELAVANLSEIRGNSPLGLSADLYHNFGWAGVVLVPALLAGVFLLIDLHLSKSKSPILWGTKLMLLFSVPLMYSPYFFLLYGGGVALALMVFTVLMERGFFRFMGIRGFHGQSQGGAATPA